MDSHGRADPGAMNGAPGSDDRCTMTGKHHAPSTRTGGTQRQRKAATRQRAADPKRPAQESGQRRTLSGAGEIVQTPQARHGSGEKPATIHADAAPRAAIPSSDTPGQGGRLHGERRERCSGSTKKAGLPLFESPSPTALLFVGLCGVAALGLPPTRSTFWAVPLVRKDLVVFQPRSSLPRGVAGERSAGLFSLFSAKINAVHWPGSTATPLARL